MHSISPVSTDSLSQFHQFNWSPSLSTTDADHSPNPCGSSALRRPLSPILTHQSTGLPPIGSHLAQSSSRPPSSNLKHSSQVGGSAQLHQSSSHSFESNLQITQANNNLNHQSDIKQASHSQHSIIHPTSHQLINQILSPSPPFTKPQSVSSSSVLNSPLSTTLSSVAPSDRRLSSSASSKPTLSVNTSHQTPNSQPLPRSSTTLWMGDLESWMDETYVRRCVIMMGWNLPYYVPRSSSGLPSGPDVGSNGVNVKIKMVSGASPSSAYCFLTYPDAEMAEHAWRMISNMPPTLMPGCERTFKLNWATGLPGVQPTWDREFSVFIRDLDREVTEGELVALFTCTFPSTKSAKIMGDLSTGLSRGYAFIRFGEESDMHRALSLGRSKNGTGMFLRGRCIKISEASGSSGTAGDHANHRSSSSGSNLQNPHNFRSRQLSAPMVSNNQTDSAEIPIKAHPRGIPPSGAVVSHPLPIREFSRDVVSHNLGSTVNPHMAPRLAQASHSRATPYHNAFHPQQMPLTSTPFNSLFPACHSSSESVAPAPIFNSRLPYQLSRSHCVVPSRTVIHPVSIPFGSQSAGQPSHLSSSPPFMPLAVAVSHQLNRFSPVSQASSLFQTFSPTSLEPSFSPNTYATTNDLLPSSATLSSPNLSPYYPPILHTAFDGLSDPSISTPHASNLHFSALAQIASVANQASNDPSNTTVFVGGLPACISEATLKTFFQNFGEITYVKIPPNKGCGFVQFVRRADAEQAMIKMHDFPIHGKSRIRLSWGRSLGDKQVEYVKKLSCALGISFESVWKTVQGQDHSTIKQIASAVAGHPTPTVGLPSTISLHSNSEQSQSLHPGLDRLSHSSFQTLAKQDLPQGIESHRSNSCVTLPTQVSSMSFSLSNSPKNQLYQPINSMNSNSDDPDSLHVSRNELQALFAPNYVAHALAHQSHPSNLTRLSRQDSTMSGKRFNMSESPTSSLGGLESSETLPNRRATIHPATPASFQSEQIPSIERYRSGSLGSSGFTLSDDTQLEALEAKWAGLSLNGKSASSVKGNFPRRAETEDLSARLMMFERGRGGILSELVEEENQETGSPTLKVTNNLTYQNEFSSTSESVGTSPPSLTYSSSQTTNYRLSHLENIGENQTIKQSSELSRNEVLSQSSQTRLAEHKEKLLKNFRHPASLGESVVHEDHWANHLSLNEKQVEHEAKVMPTSNAMRLSSNVLIQPVSLEPLDKYWKWPI
ncbi:hypothetical protein O181_013802 [Austropuccinia psidii MF-1]|uniref:RRM domain-containing protein n=1 Tax=Austropuccinia psidii MF-1 TaxID=1389203 RepID=A0A9Q3GPA3_9BASI|nr:hypothetical protein [Austropuccinia psidii MF-1]